MIPLASARERLILAVTLILLAALGIQSLVVKPVAVWRDNLQGRILQAETRLKKYEMSIRRSQLDEQTFAPFLQAYRQTGPEEQVMAILLAEIDRAKSGVNVQVIDMKPRRVRRSAPANIFSVDILVEGSLHDVTRYIHLLQARPHLFQVDTLNINRRRGGGLSCQMVLSRMLIPAN